MPAGFLIERESLEKRWMITMKKNKTPGIVYVLYVLAAATFVYGFVVLAQNVVTFLDYLKTYTFSALTAETKLSYIGLVVEPLLTYGFQISLLCAAANLLCKKDNAVEEELDIEALEEATFGTVLTEEDLEEAKNLVEASAVEAAPSVEDAAGSEE